jgi:hypothetical protein
MNILPDCAIKALAEKGFIDGMYGDVPYELTPWWSAQGETEQSFGISLDGKHIGNLHVRDGVVKVQVDLSQYLRGPNMRERADSKMLAFAQMYGAGKTGLDRIAGNMAKPIYVGVDFADMEKKILAVYSLPMSAEPIYDKPDDK